jgi:hypothetical protein
MPSVMLALILLAATGPASAGACRWDPAFVSGTTEPLSASRFLGISRAMTVREIIQRLGPAARDVGSGVHVLEWDVTDGRQFRLSTPSACDKPLHVGFSDATAGASGPRGIR